MSLLVLSLLRVSVNFTNEESVNMEKRELVATMSIQKCALSLLSTEISQRDVRKDLLVSSSIPKSVNNPRKMESVLGKNAVFSTFRELREVKMIGNPALQMLPHLILRSLREIVLNG